MCKSRYFQKYPNNDWSYHDYRNLDINTFLPAAEFLAEKKYKVIRIGTRDSELALWQANRVQRMLNELGYETKIVPIKSTGDTLDKLLT